MSRPRVRLRIEFAPAGWLGPGKIGLLESVGRTGSVTAAAADCGMSYKRAWILLKAANAVFGTALVEMSRGGRGGGGGARVTAAGQSVVAAYRRAEREAAVVTAKAFAAFPVRAGSTGAARARRPRRQPSRRHAP